MKKLAGSLSLLFFLPLLAGQQPQGPTIRAQQGNQVVMHDGGVDQVLQSIYIPPIENAPFTATVHTEWIRTLPDGGTFTLVNQRQVARDGTGRIYEERWLLMPKGGKAQPQMNLVQIADPAAHTLTNCFLLRTPHRCTTEEYRGSATATYRPPTGHSGPLPNGAGFSTHEELGSQTLAGVETVGTRDTTTYNQGVIGNDRPFNRMREFWFAPNLGIDLRSELTDPSFGRQIFTVTDVSLSEPDPKLFAIPEGFEIVDRSRPAAPSQ